MNKYLFYYNDKFIMRKEMDQMTENIYLGDINSAKIINLKKENIIKVLSFIDNRAQLYNKDDKINQKIIKVADIPGK